MDIQEMERQNSDNYLVSSHDSCIYTKTKEKNDYMTWKRWEIFSLRIRQK